MNQYYEIIVIQTKIIFFNLTIFYLVPRRENKKIVEFIDSKFTQEFVCHSLCHGDLSITCMSVALIRPPIPKKKKYLLI